MFYKKVEKEAEGALPQAKLIMRQSYFSRSSNFEKKISSIYGGPCFGLSLIIKILLNMQFLILESY
ncbi:hypothetical protein Avbf_17497, partial [Armadillidium vulgare]